MMEYDTYEEWMRLQSALALSGLRDDIPDVILKDVGMPRSVVRALLYAGDRFLPVYSNVDSVSVEVTSKKSPPERIRAVTWHTLSPISNVSGDRSVRSCDAHQDAL